MFTGIVQSLGIVKNIRPKDGDLEITVKADRIDWNKISIGESISINGICLTATKIHSDGFDADISSETMSVTTLSNIKKNDQLNIEPSLTVGDKIGGHFVTGHIDCVAEIVSKESKARAISLQIEVPNRIARYIAPKGSITVDGVSLTVNSVNGSNFNVYIIPHTAKATIIGDYKIGDKVNIEIDMMARYIERLLDKPNDGVMTEKFLRDNGYDQ